MSSSWQKRFEELRASSTPIPPTTKLGRWVSKQRDQYRRLKEGKSSGMTMERIAALEDIDFVWNNNNKKWDEWYEQLLQYKDENGDCNVPRSYNKNPRLGTWVNEQRRLFSWRSRGEKSPMTSERQALLENIGFEWVRRRDAGVVGVGGGVEVEKEEEEQVEQPRMHS